MKNTCTGYKISEASLLPYIRVIKPKLFSEFFLKQSLKGLFNKLFFYPFHKIKVPEKPGTFFVAYHSSIKKQSGLAPPTGRSTPINSSIQTLDTSDYPPLQNNPKASNFGHNSFLYLLFLCPTSKS